MYKEKLIELLKTCDEVKEAMEKLEFWCKYIAKNYHPEIFWEYSERIYTWTTHWDWIKEIIWLPLQERFIRMYCKNKWLFISFDNKNIYLQFRILLENNENWIYTIDFNNTKGFDNQPDEIYQKIYEALYNLIK